MTKKYDFAGWATRNDIVCSDGRIIRRDAFKDNDGQKVPVVWNHQHNDINNVLGHAVLENREDGVYAYGYFNDTAAGKAARIVVDNGDVTALSIYANKLKQNGPNVLHGAIREVSLVLAGANSGAYIESVIKHGEESEEEAYIRFVDTEHPIMLHSEETEEPVKNEEEKEPEAMSEEITHAEEKKEESGEKTVGDVFNTLTEEQKTVVYALIGQALESKGADDDDDEEKETPNMKHNVFSDEIDNEENVLTHSEMEAIAADAKRIGSMKEAFLQHGINQIDMLFPEAKTVGGNEPIMVQRDKEWVNVVMNGVKHSGFSRIKSMFANIDGEEARARGYIKGNYKEEEVFALLKRTTTPKTIYKKQSFDRDDVIDITDIDVIAWVKKEMRIMLNEEIARAILVSDGRSALSPDKIDEDKVRPIYKDDDFFTVKWPIIVSAGATMAAKAEAFIDECIRSRKEYKGNGNPVMFMTEDLLSECLLLKDLNKHRLYKTEEELRTAMRVSKIVTVPVMEGLTRNANGKTMELAGIYVNLSDYNVGADKGGEVNLFDDFDIDFNQMKYLIETRISGALVTPFSAVVLEFGTGAPLTLGVAPSGRDDTVIGESVRDLQTHVTVFGDKVAGTLNYVAEVEDVHDAGNFLALNIVIPSDASATAQLTGGSAASISSGNNAFAVTSSTKTLTVVVTRSGESMTKVFDLTGLTLKSA